MRKFILSLLAVLMLMSCAQKYYDQNGNELSKEQMEALRTNEVKQRLHDRHYKVLVDMMSPNRFMPRTLVHEWGISIHNDTIDCYLPYFGRAYNIPYGGGLGLDFTTRMTSYRAKRTDKSQTYIVINAPNEEDRYQFDLSVFDNRTAYLNVYKQNREPIRYSGHIKLSDWLER